MELQAILRMSQNSVLFKFVSNIDFRMPRLQYSLRYSDISIGVFFYRVFILRSCMYHIISQQAFRLPCFAFSMIVFCVYQPGSMVYCRFSVYCENRLSLYLSRFQFKCKGKLRYFRKQSFCRDLPFSHLYRLFNELSVLSTFHPVYQVQELQLFCLGGTVMVWGEF